MEIVSVIGGVLPGAFILYSHSPAGQQRVNDRHARKADMDLASRNLSAAMPSILAEESKRQREQDDIERKYASFTARTGMDPDSPQAREAFLDEQLQPTLTKHGYKNNQDLVQAMVRNMHAKQNPVRVLRRTPQGPRIQAVPA